MESRGKHSRLQFARNLATHIQLHQQIKLWWKRPHESGQSLFSSLIESKAWTCRPTYYWNLSRIIKAANLACTRVMRMLGHRQLQSPRARKMVLQGIVRSTRGGTERRGRRKSHVKALNPVEFLSSSAAPLGGVRSLWRERGKTGTVRNKAPNSHDMFS